MKTARHSASSKKRILIVDDHPLLRAGLGTVINQQHDMMVCGEASDAPSGLSAVSRRRPDAVIVDISLGRGSGLDLIKDMHAQDPDLPVLALSIHHENLYAERAIRAGALGYVMKGESVHAITAALRKVMSGRVAVSENIVSRMVARQRGTAKASGPERLEDLSDRELEVFRLFGEGCGTRGIASRLHISVSTVESYRSAIKRKLGLANATELVARAGRFIANEPPC